ncbi:hypothetical protein GCM10023169_13300 [Georgenia halophila]|uniref:Methyltransferase domain-containing protein n=1 Tax=Georgenia halophila TaxID=620889 RepID=A0ABP8KWW5_9MICO
MKMTSTANVRILDQRSPQERERTFLPGTGKEWLLPFYDAFSRFAGIRALHRRAVTRAGITAGQVVLDVGCGTGNLALAVLDAVPGARVTGLDPDGRALRRAARKAVRRGVPLTLVQGYADRLPGAQASFDHVISSLAMHHVDDDGRTGFARDVARVLRPGGMVTILDFGGPGDGAGHGHGHAHRHGLRRRRTGSPHVSRNVDGSLAELLDAAGLRDARETEHLDHRSGPVTIVQARRA